MKRPLILGIFASAALAGVSLSAQPSAPQAVSTSTHRLAFEVASVKESKPDQEGGRFGFRPGGMFATSNWPLSALVKAAFRHEPPLLASQIVGLPEWVSETRYDITAKTSSDDAPRDAGSPLAHMDEYIRSLLEDRFALRTHIEEREMPVYALVIASGGSKLRPALDCSKPVNLPKCNARNGPGHIAGGHMLLTNLLATLAGQVDRPVVNRTNLEGSFDIDLQWNPAPLTNATDERPSIFVAVQEQLGLKLESTRGPVDVLVIDHIDRPTPD